MKDSVASWNPRLERLHRAVGSVELSFQPNAQSSGPLIALTSSRLGRDVRLHRHIGRFLCRSLMDCRQRRGELLVASGSAIEPWASRAAELFAVPLRKLSVDHEEAGAAMVVRSPSSARLSRDAVVIALADRVDAVYVRRGGTVERCLRQRIEACGDASTRVAVSLDRKCAATGLIAAGAIGWYLASHRERSRQSHPDHQELTCGPTSDDWTRTDGRWLVHCTRGCQGPWPGETERQYRDSILLGDHGVGERPADESSGGGRGPLDSLLRIVRSGRLVASAIASARTHPVVCFSALPLSELLNRRCFRPQLGRWDYEPYGIAIRLSAARRLGIQAVIYGPPQQRSLLAPADQFRFHPLGKTYDWREEREWRSNQGVDLTALDFDDVRVFAADGPQARQRLQACRWQVTLLDVAQRCRAT